MLETSESKNKDLLYKKVKTSPIRVRISLSDGSSVEGRLHQPPSLRLTDLLNRNTQDNPFLPLTDAYVYQANGEHSRYKFLTVNRAMIVCCLPLEEEVPQL